MQLPDKSHNIQTCLFSIYCIIQVLIHSLWSLIVQEEENEEIYGKLGDAIFGIGLK